MSNIKRATGTMLVAIGLAGATRASEIIVNSDITTSTTWTANNVYNLEAQVYVKNGASLTIEAGTHIRSTVGMGGALIITRAGQIFALGTKAKPIVFTSKNDNGTWREAASEWGNLTIMGDAYISENAVIGNFDECNAANRGNMEGLTRGTADDQYGGGNDDDDSGTVRFVSLRFGGLVVASAVELNGLSLGGLGRETDINHIDIMNNVDDGIEIWGGTLNIKYFNIWNIGDDCFDIDQGWRGKAQFGLLVQGYSTRSAQGSGTGDNCFETDGAEDCHWQPVTTATIYNCTVIGQPNTDLNADGDTLDVGEGQGGDQATAWRANARVQYRNCIFMDVGEKLVSFDNLDGDGTCGYGASGTLSWADTWTTDFSVTSTVNPCADPGTIYQSQVDGKLAEVKDCVFFNNDNASAYTEAALRGVTPGNGTNNNVVEPVDMPIQSITRGPTILYLTFAMKPVIALDPRPAGAALVSVGAAPDDGFFTPAPYRGAFSPVQSQGTSANWACGWTAAYEFGFLTPCVSGQNTRPIQNGGSRSL